VAIIISKNGHEAKKVERSTFSKEDDLQEYLSNNPEALPVDQIREGTKILVLAREFPTQAGPIDILAVDELGTLYVIETKLYRNPDKRDVVAQVLDYGAALWKHSSEFGDFRVALSQHVKNEYDTTLEEQISLAFGKDDDGTAELLQATADCLEGGTFVFMVLMDQVHDGLRDLVSYLNANSHFQLYAVELEYYEHESYEILIPHVFGAEVKSAADAPGRPTRLWTVDEVLADAERRTGADWASIVQRVVDWASANKFPVSCGKGQLSSLSVRIVNGGHETPFMGVAVNGVLYVYFEFLKSLPAFADLERRQALLGDINSITGASLPDYIVDRWARVEFSFLNGPDVLDRLLRRLKEAMATVLS
jgi:hypothetical protein